MKTTTVKGTNDYLPSEVALRDYLIGVILNTYQNHGFERIMTPVIEDINNLDKSEGGENLNLIFKILKRGQKLNKALDAQAYNQLSDMGLRYDLTLPLSRYYANNRARLILPMKCIQIDKVYRAERPQKGRLREFVQCDIDILGTESINSEIELINTTAKALLALDIKNFKVKINDRRILKDFLLSIGFEEEQIESVSITIDKLDKIGAEGVEKELQDKQFNADSISKLRNILNSLPLSMETMKGICKDKEIVNNLETIINTVSELANEQYKIEFDVSLVRGQGYYSGTVFEIQSDDFKGSIAGGGRYDNLIGKFINEKISAVGFSIGFERIYSILLEKNYIIPNKREKIALLYEPENFIDALKTSERMQADYDVTLYEKPKKTGKFLNKLQNYGYDGFYINEQSESIKKFD